jgi:hypothetical protein
LTVSGGNLYPHVSDAYPHYITLRNVSNGAIAAQIHATAQSGNVITFRSASATLPPQGTALTVWWGSWGYQEMDLDVQRTTVLKANYNYYAKEIPAGEQIGSQTLPHSLYRSTKPAWFGNLNWPPFDPFNPAPRFDAIPAGYRYLNGGTGPTPSGPAAPTFVRIQRI